jgi:3-oxoacyl-[acyl-carrier-protein] synthase I
VSDPRPLPPADALILGVGARTASGLTALQVTMSARAHKLAPRESHLVDRNGDAIATARLMSIGDDVVGIDRFLALGGPALTQAAFPWVSAQRKLGQEKPLPVIVALPSASRPGFDPRLEQHFLRALEARSRVLVDHERSSVVTRCRGGGVLAFERALAELSRGAEAIVVGGVDTYFDPDVLEHLDRELRLHGLETENGFIPGEGAGFVLLATRRPPSPLHRYGRVLSAAVESEPHPYGSEEPTLAEGLTGALRRAIATSGLPERALGWALTDVVNERHRVDEWMFAAARNHLAFAPDAVHDQPLLKTGDLGAASAAVLVVMAAIRWQTGSFTMGGPESPLKPPESESPPKRPEVTSALIAVQSDGAERGAMVVSKAGPA